MTHMNGYFTRRQHSILLIFLSFLVVKCDYSSAEKTTKEKIKNHAETKSQPNNNTDQNTDNEVVKKYSKEDILSLILGYYVADECDFELTFSQTNKNLHYQIKTAKRNDKGIAKISIDESGFVAIYFPIEWDDYQGDMTLDTYEPDNEKKPQQVEMNFDPRSKSLNFQNYGNAMNNYVIFDECDAKGITLKYSNS